jgi:hypothetical protein
MQLRALRGFLGGMAVMGLIWWFWPQASARCAAPGIVQACTTIVSAEKTTLFECPNGGNKPWRP